MPSRRLDSLNQGRYTNNVTRGIITDESGLFFTGENSNVLSSPSEATVWDLNTSYLFSPNTGTELIDSISSSSLSDVGIAILIDGLDINFNIVQQVVLLNGQTRVPITPIHRVNLVINVSGVTPLTGEVYVYEDTALAAGVPIDLTLVKGFISIIRESSQMAIRSIPVGFTFELKTITYLLNKNGGASDVNLSIDFAPFVNAAIRNRNPEVYLGTGGEQNFNQVFDTPLPIPTNIDLEFLVNKASKNGIGCVVTVVGILVANDP